MNSQELSRRNVATMPVCVHGRHELAFVHVAIKGDAVEQTFEVNNETVFQSKVPLPGPPTQDALDRMIRGVRLFARLAKEKGHCIDLEADNAS